MGTWLEATLKHFASARPEETRAVAWSFLYFFFLLSDGSSQCAVNSL